MESIEESFTTRISAALKRQLRIEAAYLDTDMSTFARDAIETAVREARTRREAQPKAEAA